MVAAVVTILIAVIPALLIAEIVVERRRLAKWKLGHANVSDDEFFASLGPISLNRDEAIRVRLEISRATKIPASLISVTGLIRELEKFGDLWHSSILNYFTDLLCVEDPKNEEGLVTVRDFVIEFGSQLK